MSLSKLVFSSMKKNMKHYYLYFFALIFSVTLFFSFVTLQYNEDVLATVVRSGTATAGFEAATYILYFVILFFVLYANHLFIKRRSKEIGLYQLIGMTKGLIVRLIAIENIVLFIGAVIVGIIVGFFSSRLFAMILLKVLEKEALVKMAFSIEALQQSVLVFTVLLVIVLVQMAWMIHRVSLLLLFTASKQADERVKQFSAVQMIIGFLGLVFIVYGYYKSTTLFNIEEGDNLFINMLVILASTIGGTFLVFRYSVAFILNSIRIKKKGHLSGTDVLALTPIMHRMKSNAKSLTLITVLTGVSLGIMTLSYISYYSSESKAYNQVPGDYVLFDDNGKGFLQSLKDKEIGYTSIDLRLHNVTVKFAELLTEKDRDNPLFQEEGTVSTIPVSDYQRLVPSAAVNKNEIIITNYGGFMAEVFPFESNHNITVRIGKLEEVLRVVEVNDVSVLSSVLTGDGAPVFIVPDALFETFLTQPSQSFLRKQTIVMLGDKEDRILAENIYMKSDARNVSITDDDGEQKNYIVPSYETALKGNIENFGITIFTTAFLGLAFLMTTGSILYFKQMSEAEEERASYTVLRKIGFSERDIMRGIYMKQIFNFGVPLLIGLLHSYFAVKSGWFMFGSELTAPLWIAMSCYIALYAIFAVLSVGYYKKVVRESL